MREHSKLDTHHIPRGGGESFDQCGDVMSDVTVTLTAQEWNNRTLAVHERVDSRFLVLPGSESTLTEITEYTYLSQFEPGREFIYKSD